jgi:phosphate transport system protein
VGEYRDGVAREIRDFQHALTDIDAKVIQLLSLVSDGLAGATEALLASDRGAAEVVMQRDNLIDSIHIDIEELVQRQIALQAPAATDMRYLLAMLRVVPELERCGDLVEHIAKRALRNLGADLTPRIRGIVERMGRVGVELWRKATEAYVSRDPDAASHMRILDNEMDDLHAIEMALVARFYERLGDHAVNVAERIRYIANGASPRHFSASRAIE